MVERLRADSPTEPFSQFLPDLPTILSRWVCAASPDRTPGVERQEYQEQRPQVTTNAVPTRMQPRHQTLEPTKRCLPVPVVDLLPPLAGHNAILGNKSINGCTLHGKEGVINKTTDSSLLVVGQKILSAQ